MNLSWVLQYNFSIVKSFFSACCSRCSLTIVHRKQWFAICEQCRLHVSYQQKDVSREHKCIISTVSWCDTVKVGTRRLPWLTHDSEMTYMQLECAGDNLGVFVVNNLKARVEQRSMPSSAWLLPYDTFWDSSEIIVYSKDRNYTVNDYEQLFRDIGFPDGYQMRKDTVKLTSVAIWFVSCLQLNRYW